MEYEDDFEAICGECLINPPLFIRAKSALIYDEFSRKIISNFKYYDNTLARRFLSNIMSLSGKELIENSDIITVVPLNYQKIVKRRYNQSALIAKIIAEKFNKNLLLDLLVKNNNKRPQTGLAKKLRAQNIKNNFKLNKKYQAKINKKTILLIDDVLTTGATVNECSRVLLNGKVAKVNVLTIARAVKGKR